MRVKRLRTGLFALTCAMVLTISSSALYTTVDNNGINILVNDSIQENQEISRGFDEVEEYIRSHPIENVVQPRHSSPPSDGRRSDFEYDPFIMYPADPYSYGRHLLGDKVWTTGNKLYLTTYGYATEYSDDGVDGCAVPYYWSDVARGDIVRVRALTYKNGQYIEGAAIEPTRTDFGPNQKTAGDHIVDLGSDWLDELSNGNQHSYCRTYIYIRGGDHY